MPKPEKKRITLLGLALLSLVAPALKAAESPQALVESTIIEVVNQVDILSGEELKPTPATPEMIFRAPNYLQTGRYSRARMEAGDGTITRVGANTLFSFEQNGRTMHLKQGTLLFHSPSGKGGGRIVTASATASIVGTTIAIAATPDGGFKLLVLEGIAQVAFGDGTVRILEAGQMTFVLPGESGTTVTSSASQDTPGKPGPVLNFDLERLQEDSLLLNGFKEPISSSNLIDSAIDTQQRKLSSGELESTGARIITIDEQNGLILDVSETELISSTSDLNDLTKREAPAGLKKLEAAFASELTPQNDGYNPDINFFPSPGFQIPTDFQSGLQGDEIAEGLIAGRLNFITGNLDLAPIRLDPTQSGDDRYFLRAPDGININGDLVLSGFSGPSFVAMSALQFFQINNGSSVTIESSFPTGFAMALSNNDLTLEGVEITNPEGGIRLSNDTGAMLLKNTNLQAGLGTILSSGGDLIGSTGSVGSVGSETDTPEVSASIFLEGTNIESNNTQLVAEENNMISASNRIRIDSSLVAANFIEFKAAEISLTNPSFVGSNLRIIGDQLVDFSGSDLSSLASVNMEARTLILADINFSSSSQVRLGSELGMLAPNPNTSAASMSGYVNFINNVTVDLEPAEFSVPTSQGGLATGPGTIEIYSTGTPNL